MNVKIKGKVYRTVVRPALMYGAETVKEAQENKLEVGECKWYDRCTESQTLTE